VLADARVEPGAVVGDGDADVPSGQRAVGAVLDLGVRELDRQHPAGGHRVAGVHDQVDDDLLELAGVRLDRPEVRRRDAAKLDVLADQSREHLLELGDELGEVEHARLEHLAAAEGEEMAREVGGALADPADLLGLVTPRVVRVETGDEELGVAAERRQEVVEVVRDAPGQAPDGVELLRVEQLLLERLPFGDVLDEGDRVGELAAPAAHGRAREAAPADAAVGVEEALLELVAVDRTLA
jgi:hypothetical protein